MRSLLREVNADEVSPVKRGANRKRVVLKAEEGEHVDREIEDITAIPWENEGAMTDVIRKSGADEVTVRAAVGAMRLLNGIADELPDEMREAVEKLGSEMYAPANPTLNTSSVRSPGDLDGSSYGDPMDGSAPKQTDLDGEGRDGELIGHGAGKKVAADMDDDGVMKDGKEPYGNVTYADPGYQSDGTKRYPLDTEEHIRAAWSYINMPKNAAKYDSKQVSQIKGRIRAAMKRIGANVEKSDEEITADLEREGLVLPEGWTFTRLFKAMRRKPQGEKPGDTSGDTEPDDDQDDDTDDTVEKEGTEVDPTAVPVQKEDGSWDLSAVPDETRPFFEAMIQKADETAEKLEKAETDLAETREQLRTSEIIAKAEEQFPKLGATDELVEILKEAGDKMSPETYEKLEALLSGANEQVEKGALFKEIGSSLGGNIESDAFAKIEKAADELVEKSTDMSRAEAIDKVLKEQPDLYDAYMRESGLGVV